MKNLNPYKTGIVLALVFISGFIPLCVLFYKFFTNYIEFTTLQKARGDFNFITIYTISLFTIGAATLYLLAFGRNKYLKKVDVKSTGFNEQKDEITNEKVDLTLTQNNFVKNLVGTTSVETLSQLLYNHLEAGLGTYYSYKNKKLEIKNTFGYKLQEDAKTIFENGETLAFETINLKKPVFIEDIPMENLTISSGLGEAAPTFLWYYPLMLEKKILGVLEIASFTPYSESFGELIDACLAKIQKSKKDD